MSRHQNNGEHGAVLYEAALVLPVLLGVFIAAWALFDLYYTRSVVQYALQQGITLAQQTPDLKIDLTRATPEEIQRFRDTGSREQR